MSIDNATPEEWSSVVNAAKTAMKEIGVLNLEVLNTLLDKPFCEANLVDKCLAFALWQHGHPIEYLDGAGNWFATDPPAWCPGDVYRVLPKPEELVLPSIDWSAVSADLRWLSQDMSGAVHLTTARPRAGEAEWLDGCFYAEACGFVSLRLGKGDWRKLIVQRPEGV